jgi:hypothetical protein
MYRAILCQIDAPREYTYEVMRRQVALHCLQYPHVFAPYFEPIKEDEVSYEGWVRGIAEGTVWGDETVLTVVGHMWNVAITVVTLGGFHNIFHTKEVPDIVLIGNGIFGEMNHFSGTGKQ